MKNMKKTRLTGRSAAAALAALLAVLFVAAAATMPYAISPAALAADAATAPQFLSLNIPQEPGAAQDAAKTLHALGLFRGVGDNADGSPDFALERVPTRHEALVMLVRLLGKDGEALGGAWETPFTDVAGWAEPYVGYAYEKGLTNGISATEFGGYAPVTLKQYITFILRALGYQSGVDFTAEWPWKLSDRLELTHMEYAEPDRTEEELDFTRGESARLSLIALSLPRKDESAALYELLIENGAITLEAAKNAGLVDAEITIRFNGEELSGAPAPQVVRGVLYLPLSTLFEQLGLEVTWGQGEDSIEASVGDHLIRLQAGAVAVFERYPNNFETTVPSYYSNEWREYPDKLSHPPLMLDGQIHVSLEFIRSTLDCYASWDVIAKRVDISQPFVYKHGAWYITRDSFWNPGFPDYFVQEYQKIDESFEIVWEAGDRLFVELNHGVSPIMSHRLLYTLSGDGLCRLTYRTGDYILSVKADDDSIYVLGTPAHWRGWNSITRIMLEPAQTVIMLGGGSDFSYGMFITSAGEYFIDLSRDTGDDLDFEVRDDGVYTIGFDASVGIEGYIGAEWFDRVIETYGYYLLPKDGGPHEFLGNEPLDLSRRSTEPAD